MENKLIRGKTYVVDKDGVIKDKPVSPTVLVRNSYSDEGWTPAETEAYPVLTADIVKNLYGRIITLVEATTDQHKLKSVKDLFSREIKSWSEDVYNDMLEVAYLASSGINIDEDSKKD